MNTGIELQFWVVDENGQLADGRALADAHDRIEPEFVEPLVEVQTEPREDEHALRADLQETLGAALAAADDAGRRLVPLGTPLTGASPPATTDRGRLFETIWGDGARCAKNCASTHVHFEKDRVRRQLNVLTALDPALALVSSSPYYLGERGPASSRADAYRTDCGEAFERYVELWEYVDSVDQWEARVDSAYETFHGTATDRDVPPERVFEHFSPEDTVLNPVRLRHEHPTVEWRAPDVALPSQVVSLAADVKRLVASTREKAVRVGGDVGVHPDRIVLPEFDRLRALSRTAIEDGLAADAVTEYLAAFGVDATEYRPIARRLDGPESLAESEARRIRLEYARRLEADVDTLTVQTPVAF